MEQEEGLQATGEALGMIIRAQPFTRQQLADRVNELLQTDFAGLVALLYRLDVDEDKLRTALDLHAGTDAALLITDLIIERQLQRIRSRQQYSRTDPGIDEEERW